MRVLNTAITSKELSNSVGQVAATAHAGFANTMHAFEIQAGQITVREREIKKASDEIHRILADCRTFVQQTRDEANSASVAMLLETQALHEKQQAIVKFVEGVPDTVAGLKANLDGVTARLSSSNLEGVGNWFAQVEVSYEKLEARVFRRLDEGLRAATVAAGSTGAGAGF